MSYTTKIRNFLWDGSGVQHKIHLVAWDEIQRSLKEGGFVIQSMRQSHATFLAEVG